MPAAPLRADEFAQAFARHGRTLWVLAAAWVGRSEAADLVQETARVAWQQRAQFEPGSDERAWLSQIARHLGANWRRRRRPVPMAPDELPDSAAPAQQRQTWPFDAERLGLSDGLARGLAGLPEVARACLLLHVVLGHTFGEIAAMLEIPENTAQSHARRARTTLREALGEAAGRREPMHLPTPETP